ncbi:MAG: hypothetical protein Athens071416_141 [Parcubacteria group bacterium Athens0714_16]|nr:MAG: hypothetical protein Athens071416_141 [Parcubacteria group bacterium Athens0714_16]
MVHIAIMKKSWGFVPKILSGEKTIESRWYQTRRVPWGVITSDDVVYFKNSGEPITVQVVVSSCIQFSDLTPIKITKILNKYHKEIGILKKEKDDFFEKIKDKKYCILVFIKKPKKIKPFEINKKGFGMMSAWISVDDINMLK